MAKNPEVYDVVIVGSGLTGLSLGAQCRQLGLKFLVLEARDVAGGSLRPNITQFGRLPSSLGFIPESPLARERLEQLGTLLQDSLAGESLEQAPQIAKGGELKPFVGFADLDLKSLELFSHFNQSQAIELKSQPDYWVEQLLEPLSSQIMTLAEVTSFEVSEGLVQAAVINADRKIMARSFVFTAPVSGVNELFLGQDLNQRSRQMLAKAKAWTAISLHLQHQEPFPMTEPGLLFLLGTKTEPEPCVGRFFPQEKCSSWLGFVPSEFSEDSEFVGEALRHMKKLVRRAFQLDEGAIIGEKITLSPETQGRIQLKTKVENQLPEIKNLYLASPTLSSAQGLEAALDMAFKATEWLQRELSLESESLPTENLHVREQS